MEKTKRKVWCKDCKELGFGRTRGGMVMVNDALWGSICDNLDDTICCKCMEKRMGREITKRDFMQTADGKIIPCNQGWLWSKEKREEKMKKYSQLEMRESFCAGARCGSDGTWGDFYDWHDEQY